MPTLRINNQPVEVPNGATLLEAARRAGETIPTLCHLDGLEPATSCMLCVVKDAACDRLLPSCSAPAEEGMHIETGTAEIAEARRDVLELLLSEHLGDCEAPCEMICPAHVPIPELIRLVLAGQEKEAARLHRERIPLAGVLERICTSPCERGCRRGFFDESISIRNICRYTADLPFEPEPFPTAEPVAGSGGKRQVGIIGAGPTGLSAAFYLTRKGYRCSIYDDHPEPGGMLRYAVPETKLPREVLDREIDLLLLMGVEFQGGVAIGRDIPFAEWRHGFDAVVLAVGQISDPDNPPASLVPRQPHPSPRSPEIVRKDFGIATAVNGIKADSKTMEVEANLFAGGDAVRFHRMCVRAVSDGWKIAESVTGLLESGEAAAATGRFNIAMGRLSEVELARFAERASPGDRVTMTEDPAAALDKKLVHEESGRCLACDCGRKEDCGLRDYSEEYGARATRLKPAQRPVFEEDRSHDEVVFEPGKCIRCGLCVRVADREGESIGLTFVGRSADMLVGVPFGESIRCALEKCAAQCVEVCPTGALAESHLVKPVS